MAQVLYYSACPGRYPTFWLRETLILSTANTVSRISHGHVIVSYRTFVMSSSLEDRVRLLTDRAITATTQSELDAILPELKAAIRDYIRYLRAIAVETVPEAFGNDSKAA